MAVQAVIGSLGSSSGQTASPTATGSAVGAGHCIVGAAAYFNSSANGDFISNVSDGTFNCTLLDHLVTSDSKLYLTTFVRFGISNAPTGFTANFSSNVTFSQVGWIEYALAGGAVVGHGGQSQTNPGAGANAITSGSFSAGTGPVVGFCVDRNAQNAVITAGTGYSLQFQDATSGDWDFTGEDKTGAGGSTAATFTDTFFGASHIYVTGMVSLNAGGCGSLALLGVGCAIALAREIENNPIVTRRRLILPHGRLTC